MFQKNLLDFLLSKTWYLLLLTCSLNLKDFKLHPQNTLTSFVRLSKKTDFVSQYIINLLILSLKRSMFAARYELNL